MIRREIQPDSIYMEFYCDRCEKREENVDVQECIYNGPPMCSDCNIEMSLDKMFIEE
jgi:NAD-dependent SIR2 family protein deacetylase